MKQSFEQALAMLAAQGKPSIFRIIMKPVAPTIIHMYDIPPVTEEPVKVDGTAAPVPLGTAALEPAAPEPVALAPLGAAPLPPIDEEPPTVDVTPTPPTTPDIPKPVVFVSPLRYEFHTVVVLKKWWATLSCKHCKTVEQVGFPVNP